MTTFEQMKVPVQYVDVDKLLRVYVCMLFCQGGMMFIANLYGLFHIQLFFSILEHFYQQTSIGRVSTQGLGIAPKKCSVGCKQLSYPLN